MTLLLHIGKKPVCSMHPSSECDNAINSLLKFLLLASDIPQTAHTNGSQTCLQIKITWGDFKIYWCLGSSWRVGTWPGDYFKYLGWLRVQNISPCSIIITFDECNIQIFTLGYWFIIILIASKACLTKFTQCLDTWKIKLTLSDNQSEAYLRSQ